MLPSGAQTLQRGGATEGGATVRLQGVLWGPVAEGHLAIGDWVQDPDNSAKIIRLGASSENSAVKSWASVEPFTTCNVKSGYRRAFELTSNAYTELGDSRSLSSSTVALPPLYLRRR